MLKRFAPVLFAALCLSARADDLEQALEALKSKSSGPRSVPDKGDFGRRPGWIAATEEEKLLDPFRPLTTEQARRVVPKLLEMLKDETGVYGNAMGMSWRVQHRALEALVVISFERFGAFDTGGELKPEEQYEKERKEAEKALAEWPKWWEKNKGREISEWRREQIKDDLDALSKDRAAGIGALAKRGLEMRGTLTKEEMAIAVGAARDGKETTEHRIDALRLAIGSGAPEAADVAWEFAMGRATDEALSNEGFARTVELGLPGIKRVVDLLYKIAGSAEGKLPDADASLYLACVTVLRPIIPTLEAGEDVPGGKMIRLYVAGRADDWLQKQRK